MFLVLAEFELNKKVTLNFREKFESECFAISGGKFEVKVTLKQTQNIIHLDILRSCTFLRTEV